MAISQEKERYRSDQIDMTDQLAIRSNQAHFDEKYAVLDRTDYVSHYSKLKFPMAPKHNSPIRPGIFKGTTRDGGIQLVMLSYVEDTLNVNVTKITVITVIKILTLLVKQFYLNFIIGR